MWRSCLRGRRNYRRRQVKPKKARRLLDRLVSGNLNIKSHSAGDLATAEAASADVNMLGGSVYYGLDALHVRLPSTVGASVGVRHLDAERDILLTELTLCHGLKHLLACVCCMDSFYIIPDTAVKCKRNFKSARDFFVKTLLRNILRPDACKSCCQMGRDWLI